MKDEWCSNCEDEPAIAKSRCEPCYRYNRRHGRERPEQFWGSKYERRYRAFNAELEREEVARCARLSLNP